MQKPPTQTHFEYVIYTGTFVYVHIYKHPHTLLWATPEEHPAESLNECFSFSPASEQLFRCSMGTVAVDNNVLYRQKLIIILFWYSYIACRGAISFLIKTNCLSLTSTEFFLQLSDENKYVLIFSSRCIYACLWAVCAYVCVCGFCLSIFMGSENLKPAVLVGFMRTKMLHPTSLNGCLRVETWLCG